MNGSHCKGKVETPTCHVARQEGHGWALALNGTPNRRPRFYAVKLYSSLFKYILHRLDPFKCFIHPPLVALFTLAMISKLFGGCWIAVVVKHLIHTRQITQFQSSWTKNKTIWLVVIDYFLFHRSNALDGTTWLIAQIRFGRPSSFPKIQHIFSQHVF